MSENQSATGVQAPHEAAGLRPSEPLFRLAGIHDAPDYRDSDGVAHHLMIFLTDPLTDLVPGKEPLMDAVEIHATRAKAAAFVVGDEYSLVEIASRLAR